MYRTKEVKLDLVSDCENGGHKSYLFFKEYVASN